ncbi:MAG TPA: hypothetical protein VGG74_28650 [Kofleriaceae bacterium]|jgi:hypothetical protein
MTPARQERGRELARDAHDRFLRVSEHSWIVPSATHAGKAYAVDQLRMSCTCLDGEPGNKCKHLWAVQYISNAVTLIDGTRLAPPPVEDSDGAAASVAAQGGAS